MIFSKVHSIAALSAGLLFCILSLSGSGIVISLAGHTNQPSPLKRASLDQINRELQERYPNLYGPWAFELPTGSSRVIRCIHSQPTDRSGITPPSLVVTIDGNTGQLQETAIATQTFEEVVHDIHITMLAGNPGKVLASISGLAGLIITMTGLQSLLRSSRRNRKLTLTSASTRSAFAELIHRSIGIACLPLLLFITLTGVMLSVLPRSDGNEESHQLSRNDIRSTAIPGERPLQIEEAILIARGLFPSATVTHIALPSGETGTFKIELCRPPARNCQHTKTAVWIDQNSGQIRDAMSPTNSARAQQLTDKLLALHSGEAFSSLGEAVWFLVGLSPFVLFVTGCYSYCIRKNWLNDKPFDFNAVAVMTYSKSFRLVGDRSRIIHRKALREISNVISALKQHLKVLIQRLHH